MGDHRHSDQGNRDDALDGLSLEKMIGLAGHAIGRDEIHVTDRHIGPDDVSGRKLIGRGGREIPSDDVTNIRDSTDNDESNEAEQRHGHCHDLDAGSAIAQLDLGLCRHDHHKVG